MQNSKGARLHFTSSWSSLLPPATPSLFPLLIPFPPQSSLSFIGLVASLDQIENDFNILDETCFYSMQLA